MTLLLNAASLHSSSCRRLHHKPASPLEPKPILLPIRQPPNLLNIPHAHSLPGPLPCSDFIVNHHRCTYDIHPIPKPICGQLAVKPLGRLVRGLIVLCPITVRLPAESKTSN